MRRVDGAVAALRIADDVVVEIGLDLPIVILGVLREQLAAIEPLLFPGEHGKDECRGKFVLRKNTRGFDHGSRA